MQISLSCDIHNVSERIRFLKHGFYWVAIDILIYWYIETIVHYWKVLRAESSFQKYFRKINPDYLSVTVSFCWSFSPNFLELGACSYAGSNGDLRKATNSVTLPWIETWWCQHINNRQLIRRISVPWSSFTHKLSLGISERWMSEGKIP